MKETTYAPIYGVWQRLPEAFGGRAWRWSVLILLLAAVLGGGESGALVRDTLAEAYLQVSVFVAGTLMLLFAVERWFAVDLRERIAQARVGQVPIATALGMLPGCGGAIVVVTQFVNGRIGFGALVAVLIATMGDAAFLLIAAAPETAVVVFAVSGASAVLCGWAIEAIHGRDFLRHRRAEDDTPTTAVAGAGRPVPPAIDGLWAALWAIGVPFAVLIAFQQDPNAWFGPWAAHQPATWLGFAGAMLAVTLWAGGLGEGEAGTGGTYGESSPLSNPGHGNGRGAATNAGPMAWVRCARTDTNFVTVWVIAAFLLFEFGVVFSGVDPEAWFAVVGPLAPLVGVLVGFIPGCGPQILLTTLYLSGAMPMSALLANAISNDGDALFPAIALAPKAAVLATAYSALPALAVGYAAFGLGY